MTREASQNQIESLVQAASDGDEDAFASLLGMWHGRAWSTARGILRHRDGIEDVIQDAAWRSFEKLPQLQDPKLFGPWFLRTVRNTALNAIRSRKNREGHVSIDAEFEPIPAKSGPGAGRLGESPSAGSEADELKKMIEQALSLLPEVQRLCVQLFSIEKKSHKEVAEMLGISVEFSKWNVCQARKTIKKQLEGVRV